MNYRKYATLKSMLSCISASKLSIDKSTLHMHSMMGISPYGDEFQCASVPRHKHQENFPANCIECFDRVNGVGEHFEVLLWTFLS